MEQKSKLSLTDDNVKYIENEFNKMFGKQNYDYMSKLINPNAMIRRLLMTKHIEAKLTKLKLSINLILRIDRFIVFI